MYELAIAQYGTACQIQITVNLYHYVDLIGIAHSLEENRLVRVVVRVGCIDIGYESHLAVSTLHITPSRQILIGFAHQVEADILEGRTDDLYLIVFLVSQLLSCQFFLTYAEQEASFFLDATGGRTDFLCQHIVLFQQFFRIVKQFNGFLPETDIWFYVALYGGVWGTATATLGTRRLLGIEDGIVL